ncbi:hypothetical protein [Acetobacter indonesiensis]|uniref:hypothetical protein n=1 Tax=Acetobacter indonesiensis TaxID=104101 RepID=UPI0015C4E98E|nr:hypothetical protein [Acetobacter indonesiensis]
MKAANFSIEDVRTAVVAGRTVKLFKAYELKDGAFVFCGELSAPAHTADKNLWKIAAAA